MRKISATKPAASKQPQGAGPGHKVPRGSERRALPPVLRAAGPGRQPGVQDPNEVLKA